MRSALPVSAVALHLAVKAKGNASCRAASLRASTRADAADAMVALSKFFVRLAHRANTHPHTSAPANAVGPCPRPCTEEVGADLALVWSTRGASALSPNASFPTGDDSMIGVTSSFHSLTLLQSNDIGPSTELAFQPARSMLLVGWGPYRLLQLQVGRGRAIFQGFRLGVEPSRLHAISKDAHFYGKL